MNTENEASLDFGGVGEGQGSFLNNMNIGGPLDLYLLNGVISGNVKKDILNADLNDRAEHMNINNFMSESANDTINPSDTMR
jgi:hypothetical protein